MSLIEDLLDLQTPIRVRISPDGKTVVYTTSTNCRPKHTDRAVSPIWLAQIGVERSAHQITSGKYNDTNPKWSPKGDSIAFVADREIPGKSSAIYVLPLQFGIEPYAITAPDNARAVEDFQWSPDGMFIAYISADEKSSEQKHREKEKNDARVWGENIVYSRLRLVNVVTREVTTLVDDFHVTGLAWSTDGTRIACIHAKKPGVEGPLMLGSSVSLFDVATKGIQPVAHFPSSIDSPMWSGKSLYFTANVVPKALTSAQALWSIDLSSERPEFQRTAHGEDDCVGTVVAAGGDVVVVSAKRAVASYIHILNSKKILDLDGEISTFDARLSPGDTDITLAVVTSSVGVPPELYSSTSHGGQLIQLSSHGDVFKKYSFGTASVLRCPTADGQTEVDAIYLSPTHPRSKIGAKAPFPTAVICHGGPYARSTNAFNSHPTSMVPVLLEAGYGILMPNYRGSSGRGETFAAYSRGVFGIIDYNDVITLTQLAIDKGLADKDNLLIGGWSNGGSLSNLASVRNGMHGLGWRYKAAIVGAGTSEPDTMRLTSDMGLTFGLDLAKGAPWESDIDDIGFRTRASSLWTFKKAVDQGGVVPPMLILHGEQDPRVPLEQAVGTRRALQHYNLPFEFVSYPREGHRIVERMHLKDLMERVLRWANTYISPV